MKNVPVIKTFNTSEAFKYLWLKYVTGFDLSVHCAKCLIGNYSQKIGAQVKSISNSELDEFEAKYYYLCGVTSPYRYRDNFHLAFKFKEGAKVIKDFNKTHIEIDNAEEIEILNNQTYWKAGYKGKLWEFNTCRNWRFAFQMTNQK